MLIKRIRPSILIVLGVTSMPAMAGAPRISLLRESGGTDRIDPITQQLRRGLCWSHGGYFFVDRLTGQAPIFYTLDNEGALVTSARFEYSGAGDFYVTSYDRMRDGTLVFAGMTSPRGSRINVSPFLAWMSADGRDQHTVSTGRYLPYSLAVAPDDTIWTLGYEADTINPDWHLDENAYVLRHFDKAGKLLKSAFPLSDWKILQQSPHMHAGLLAVSEDRLGWYSSLGDGKAVYIEIFLRDFSTTIYPGPSPSRPDALDVPMRLGITESGTSSVWIQEHSPGTAKAYILDLSSKRWVPIEVPHLGGFAFTPHLIGTEHEDLVFQYGREARFFRVQQ